MKNSSMAGRGCFVAAGLWPAVEPGVPPGGPNRTNPFRPKTLRPSRNLSLPLPRRVLEKLVACRDPMPQPSSYVPEGQPRRAHGFKRGLASIALNQVPKGRPNRRTLPIHFRLFLLTLLSCALSLPAATVIDSDVCVYGGTSGGVIAAVQAARLGKSVSLVVVNNHLGGMTSGGLGQTDVGNFGNTYIQGTAREFYTRIGLKYSTSAKFTFEPHVAETVFNEMAQQAGLTIYTNQRLASVTKTGAQLIAVTMNNSNVFRAKMFIDASYEGDLMAAGGVSYVVGREATSQYNEDLNGVRAPNTGGHQFGSLQVNPYVITNNPASGLIPLVQSNAPGAAGSADQKVQAYNFRMCLTTVASNQIPLTAPTNYSPAQYDLLARYIQAMVAAGNTPTLGTFMNVSAMPNSKTDINNNGAVSTDFLGQSSAYPEASAETRAQIWQAHRDYLHGFLYFLATDSRVPSGVRTSMSSYGFCKDEFQDTGGWPHQLYVREARRMVSDYVMTQSNCLGLVVVPDSVGLAAYGRDSHNAQRVVVSGLCQNEGDTYTGGAIPGVYPISYRSLVPKSAECSNLLVPWCLSASHIAFGSIRMEPVHMILGQSAATAACIAIDDSTTVQQISVAKLQSQLMADQQSLGITPTNSGPTVIVDNADATGVVTNGPWTVSTASTGYYGPNYFHDGNTNKGGSSVVFTPNLPSAGKYNVYALWAVNPNRSTNTPMDVIHPGGTNTVLRDQTSSNGTWVLLLSTNFNAGTNGKVRIRNTGTTGYVIADAVQFVNASNQPVVNLWATDAHASRYGPRPGSVTLSRSGDASSPLTVNWTLNGTASNGVDFAALPASVTFPAGVSDTNLLISPFILTPVGDKTLQLSLATNSTYAVGPLATATVTVADIPLYAWRAQYFGANANNPLIAGDGANPSGDGIVNLLKYALGLDPTRTNTSPALLTSISATGYFAVSYTRPDPAPPDISYVVESSTNLLDWCPDPCVNLRQVVFHTNHTATLTWETDVPITVAPRRFLRLRVSAKDIAPPIQGAKVVAFGDSITFGQGVPTGSNWVNQLAARFALNMVNAGVSGNTSSQGLARIQTDVLNPHPDFVIINFGMNDHVMTALDVPQVSQATFRANLNSMIDRVRTNHSIPILVTVNYLIEGNASQYYYNRHPAAYYANVGGAQAWVDSYIQIVRDVAAARSADLVDIRAACDNYDRYQFLRSLLNGANDDDGVHPYLIGSSVYAQLLGDYLAAHY